MKDDEKEIVMRMRHSLSTHIFVCVRNTRANKERKQTAEKEKEKDKKEKEETRNITKTTVTETNRNKNMEKENSIFPFCCLCLYMCTCVFLFVVVVSSLFCSLFLVSCFFLLHCKRECAWWEQNSNERGKRKEGEA